MGAAMLRTPAGDAELIADAMGETPEFLLLHAGGESRRVWAPVQERLARSGYGSLAYDLRGHGDSGGSRRERIETFADDVKRMLRRHREVRTIVGASLGGLSAMLALAEQDVQARVESLVLVDVAPAPDPDRVRGFLNGVDPRLANSDITEDILKKGPRFLEAASRLRLPLLLVRAGAHGPMSNEEVFRFRALCPHMVVAHIDAAGHLIARDAPIELADAILSFKASMTSAVRNIA